MLYLKELSDERVLELLATTCDEIEDARWELEIALENRACCLREARRRGIPTTELVALTGFAKSHLNNIIAGRR